MSRPSTWRRIFLYLTLFHTFVALLLLTIYNTKGRVKINSPQPTLDDLLVLKNVSSWLRNRLTNNTVTPPYEYKQGLEGACGNGTVLLLMVVTSPAHSEHRKAVRETWGADLVRRGAKLLFFMGRSEKSSLEDVLDKESAEYKDLIRVKFTENYATLSVKIITMLRWVSLYCTNARFVLKADDDIYLNPGPLMKAIGGYNDSKAIYGFLGQKWTPIRDKKNKWGITIEMYPNHYYPDFVTGPGYIISAAAVDDLYEVGSRMPTFFLEDVFITGFVAELAGIPRYSQPGIICWRDAISACRFDSIIVSHGYTPKALRAKWASTHRAGYVCRTKKKKS